MICNKFVDNSHLVEKANKYIVYTNILIYLFGDTALKTETKKIKMLSDKYNQALNLGCKIYIPAVVISEFINRWHKLEFEKLKRIEKDNKLNYKKDYRNTEKYKENNKFIIKTIKSSILSRCIMINDNFNDEDKEKLFADNDEQDFNDVLIINMANKNDCYLLSADIDVKKISIC